MGNLVGKLLIDEWFKMIAFGGFVLLVLSLTIKLQVDNLLILCVGLALLFMGVAEMAMRPYREKIIFDNLNRPAGKISGRMRRTNASGVIMYIIATLSVASAIARGWVLLGQA
ncbi:MAG: hypothetical protein ACN6OK_05700 [Alcaligenes faecalis]